jgi:hypothetical protein
MLCRLAHARLSLVAAILLVLLFVPGIASHGYAGAAAAAMADTLSSSAIGEAMPLPMSMSGDCAGCGGEGGDASVAACQTMCPGAFGIMPDTGVTRADTRKPLDAFGGQTARRGRAGPPDPYPPKAARSR